MRNKAIVWHDKHVMPGEDWDNRIISELEQADIVLFLVSANSIGTDYIEKRELPIIHRRARNEECIFIPIILNFYDWEPLDFAEYSALPKKWKPILDTEAFPNPDKAWTEVAQGIRRKVEDFLSRKR